MTGGQEAGARAEPRLQPLPGPLHFRTAVFESFQGLQMTGVALIRRGRRTLAPG